MQSAASLAMTFNSFLFSQKKSHNWDGIVKTMCCHDVFGRMSCWCWIQTSVAFFPQDEQPLLLQVKHTYFTWKQPGVKQQNSWYPRILCRQLNSLTIAFGMAGRNVALCFSWKRHQLWLVVRICFMVYRFFMSACFKSQKAGCSSVQMNHIQHNSPHTHSHDLVIVYQEFPKIVDWSWDFYW